MNRAHVEKKKYPRGDLRFPTWIFEKGGNRTNFLVRDCCTYYLSDLLYISLIISIFVSCLKAF